MDEAVYVDVSDDVALTVRALNHFDEVTAAATHYLRGWYDHWEIH